MVVRRLGPAMAWVPIVALMSGCFFGHSLEGDGSAHSESRSLEAFTAVDSVTSLDVSIKRGSQQHVELVVDENLLPLITTRVDNGVLVIDSTDPIQPRVPGPHVIITIPALERAEAAGSGQMKIGSFDNHSPVRLVLSGSGSVAFDGAVSDLEAELTGSGDMNLSGTADTAELGLSGSGQLDAKGMSSAGASVVLSGSGDIAATVDGKVNASLSGSGNIDLYGKPQVGPYKHTGSGTMITH